MDAPICDFISAYCRKRPMRLHMPGHKGTILTGIEPMDITEIPGADSLYTPEGIIKRSEENASRLFGCPTFYSTEGSSQCIRAMLHMVRMYGGEKTVVAAARNVHRSFLTAVAMLDLQVHWLYSKEMDSYLSCQLDMEELEQYLANERPTALYITTPDYLGNMMDVGQIAELCHRYKVLLVVDNAHGAYLRFLNPTMHPIALGADLCCDSAHKTLPALTGGAYLHVSESAPLMFKQEAKNALLMYGSTSPSYLILQSLDLVNVYLVKGFRYQLKERIRQTDELKEALRNHGYELAGNEPLKLTICPKSYGYTGQEIHEMLRLENMYCEYADPDHLVIMISADLSESCLLHLREVLLDIPRREPILEKPPEFRRCEVVMSVREASLKASRTLPTTHTLGMVLAAPSVGCPPAVPIAICGERIDLPTIRRFEYYGVQWVTAYDDEAVERELLWKS